MSSSNQRPANRGFRSVLRCAISHYRQFPCLSAPEPRLVEPQHLPLGFRTQVQRLKTEIGYLKFHAAMNELPDFSSYLGADYDPRITARVWICPSVDGVQKAWQDAREGRPSRHPIASIQIPSIYDATICPAGKHVLSIFSEYAPIQLAEGTWDERRQEVGESLIDTVTAYAPNFRDAIQEWRLFTPLDLERRVNLTFHGVTNNTTLTEEEG